jgi:hypothetical protein
LAAVADPATNTPGANPAVFLPRIMGNEPSTVVDENTPPSVLESRSIEAVAKYIKEKNVRNIVVMVCPRINPKVSRGPWPNQW